MISVFVFDGFQILDLTGPVGVFAAACDGAAYSVNVVSADGGKVQSSSGIAVDSIPIRDAATADTFLVVGGTETGLRTCLANAVLMGDVTRAAKAAGRSGSVCVGAFVFAATGLFDGRQITTHWASAQRLGSLFPAVRVVPDAIWVEDEGFWSSAGVTCGIDMALAMVARDLGGAEAARVARHLAVYAQRPGHQSQFSTVLEAQVETAVRMPGLVDAIRARIGTAFTVGDIANAVGMSERTFQRRVVETTGMPPGRLIDTLRLEEAQHLLASGEPVKRVASSVGYRSEAAFRTAFRKAFGMAPGAFAVLHGNETLTETRPGPI